MLRIPTSILLFSLELVASSELGVVHNVEVFHVSVLRVFLRRPANIFLSDTSFPFSSKQIPQRDVFVCQHLGIYDIFGLRDVFLASIEPCRQVLLR